MKSAYLLYAKVKTGEKIRRGPFPRADTARMISIGAELMRKHGLPEDGDQMTLLSVFEPSEQRSGESLEIEAHSLDVEIIEEMMNIAKKKERRKSHGGPSGKGLAPA